MRRETGARLGPGRCWRRRALASMSAAAISIVAAGALATSPAMGAALDVVVTSKPIHALVAAVMEGVGTPRLLVSGTQSPHSYALKPSDAAASGQAAVIFRVAADVEPFTQRLFASLPKKVRRVSLAESPGVTRIAVRSGGAFAAHDHGKHDQGGHDRAAGKSADGSRGENKPKPAANKHDEDHDHSGEGGRLDGHVWLDPVNALAMVDEITRVLAAARPGEATRLAGNAARVKARIGALDREIAALLHSLGKRPFVLFHDATHYFERRYGLSAAGAIVADPDASPSARRLAEVRARVRDSGVGCVFAEPQISRRLVTAVQEGSAARVGSIDPEGTALSPGPDLYERLMRAMAQSFADCLGGG